MDKVTLGSLRATTDALLLLNRELLERLAKVKGISIKCDCGARLEDDDLQHAIDDNIKNMACKKCYRELYEEQRHPDER